MLEEKGKNLVVYLGTDRQLFDELRKEIKAIWFKKYGENLVVSKLLISALKALKEQIEIEKEEIK